MTEHVIIDARFHGPPESGNGGYTCGIVASFVSPTGNEAVEVTLRKPPPLETRLDVDHRDGGQAVLLDGETVVAEGAPITLEIGVPGPVSLDDAAVASQSFAGFQQHYFPTCFVCGPKRTEGDGLRIFAGNVPGRDLVASPWTPDRWLGESDGTVRPEFLWAALDCPGGFAVLPDAEGGSIVLGRMAGKLVLPVWPGEQLVVIGWRMGKEGRKMYSGSAIFSEGGSLHGFARSTWFRLS